ncbi:MAG: hypothetical protein ACP5FS_07955 [Athalassotoga sp.]
MLQALHRRIRAKTLFVLFVVNRITGAPSALIKTTSQEINGHRSPQCPDKDSIPRYQWAIKKAMAGMQSIGKEDASDDDKSIKTSTSNRSVINKKTEKGWSGLTVSAKAQECGSMHKQIDQKKSKDTLKDLKDVILLDSGSSIGATFMNPDLVTGIKVAKHPLMKTTNAGSKVIELKGHGNGFGKVYYDPTSMANIFGLAQLAVKYQVTFDSDVENAFVVHVDDRVVKFARTPEGLYAYKPSDRYLAEVADSKCMNPPDSTDAVTAYRGRSFLISSVEENRKGYTQRQFDDAK